MNDIPLQTAEVPSLLRRLPIAGRTFLKSSVVRRLLMAYRHRGLSAADVFLASYPKSGNTWLRHLLTHIATGKPTLWRGSLDKVSDAVGRHFELPRLAIHGGRLIKTHEPYRPCYRRAVLLVRDPRDVVVSEFHFRKTYSSDFYRYHNDFKVFAKAFINGKTGGYGNWSSHVSSWMVAGQASKCDLLVVPFERMKSDTFAEVQRIVDFIGLTADEPTIHEAIEHCGIGAMKKKEEEYWLAQGRQNLNFVRGGKSGNWREHFDSELEEEFWDAMRQGAFIAGYEREPLRDES